MKTFKTITLFTLLKIFLIFNVTSQALGGEEINEQHYVVLVSFDGFRSDYAQRWNLTNFLSLKAEGTSAKGLIPVYPSKTFPNHYTIVTGLYPGSHGLVDNSFYDPKRKLGYSIGKRSAVEDEGFYDGVPIWQQVQNTGQHAASFFWVGSEAPIAGSFPDYYQPYNSLVPNEQRVDQVLQWLQLPEAERPIFVSLYFSLVDSESHHSGPLSEKTRISALEADQILGSLMHGLAALPFAVNLLVVSDHGMYTVEDTTESQIFLPELVADNEVVKVFNQTQILIYSKDTAHLSDIYERYHKKHSRFKVYRKEETPAAWHYREHSNIGDLLLVAEPGYVFVQDTPAKNVNGEKRGVHGYDPNGVPELNGIFYARGPDIQAGLELPAFENVDIFPFLMRLLKIPLPENVDGTASTLEVAILDSL